MYDSCFLDFVDLLWIFEVKMVGCPTQCLPQKNKECSLESQCLKSYIYSCIDINLLPSIFHHLGSLISQLVRVHPLKISE